MYRAGAPVLSPRLKAAAAFVRPGAPVADIGCDHGKLAVYLVMAGISPFVVAVDKNPLPLARVEALAAQTGCGGAVDCRLGDGLGVITPDEVQDIVIAGLSGETISEILGAAPAFQQNGIHLVLVPVTRAGQLRRWLCEHGFKIQAEKAVEDAGKVYTVLSAGYTGECFQPDPLFCELGLLPDNMTAQARRYVEARLRYLRSRLAAPLLPEAQKSLETLIEEVEACLG